MIKPNHSTGARIFPTVVALLVATLLVASCNTTQSPSSQADDVQITAQVKTNLATEVSASSLTNIEVNTTDGVVTLAGEVETQDVKSRAEVVARAVPGVLQVNNNLQVAATSSRAQ